MLHHFRARDSRYFPDRTLFITFLIQIPDAGKFVKNIWSKIWEIFSAGEQKYIFANVASQSLIRGHFLTFFSTYARDLIYFKMSIRTKGRKVGILQHAMHVITRVGMQDFLLIKYFEQCATVDDFYLSIGQGAKFFSFNERSFTL
jgi:hypothetical protein